MLLKSSPPYERRSRTGRFRIVVMIFTLNLAVSAAGRLEPNASAEEPKTGGVLSGRLPQGAKLRDVVAVNRATKKRFRGKYDSATGRFEIGGLPLEATYDLVLDFPAARLEGIRLQVPRSDYEEEQPLEKADRATIRDKVRRMNKFEDVVQILEIRGNIQHAAVLLNKVRTRPFFGSKPGEVIWRAELWHFERPEETWVKVQDELFVVLYRERLQSAAYRGKSLTWDAALGGLRLTRQAPRRDMGEVKPPDVKPGIRFRETRSATAKRDKQSDRQRGSSPVRGR